MFNTYGRLVMKKIGYARNSNIRDRCGIKFIMVFGSLGSIGSIECSAPKYLGAMPTRHAPYHILYNKQRDNPKILYANRSKMLIALVLLQ